MTIIKIIMNNILVTGCKGQLGSELKELSSNYSSFNFFLTSSSTLDITKKQLLEKFIVANNINIIINCAAYTEVDNAEDEFEKSNLINNIAVGYLGELSKSHSVKLIHISTDYVFDGKSNVPYNEEEKTKPLNVYGKTKREGEKKLVKINPKNSIIIRTSWVYSTYGNNFVKTMLRLSKTKNELSIISDQIGTPTYAKDLAIFILEILTKLNSEGINIYNYSNEGVCSWYDFAHEIFWLEKIECKVKPIETKDYITKAIRPMFTLMNKSKIKKDFEIEIPHWKESLIKCLKNIK